MTNAESKNTNIKFDAETFHTDASSSLNVGIMNRLGDIIEVATLKELAQTGECHQQLRMFNYGQHFGDVAYELVIPGTERLLDKLAHVRTLKPNNTTAAPDKYPERNLIGL